MNSNSGALVAFDVALAECLARVAPISRIESCRLSVLLGRVCFEPIISPISIPQMPLSAMDGFAVNLPCGLEEGGGFSSGGDGTLTRFKIVGKIAAGECPQDSTVVLQTGQACHVLTGAPIPVGANRVLPQEDVQVVESEESTIQLDWAVTVERDHIKQTGSDVCAGALLFERGHVFAVADIALLASVGIAMISVYAQPRVCLLSTGNELVPPGQPIQPWQTYNANHYGLQASLQTMGLTDLDEKCLADDPLLIETFLRDQAKYYDVFISTGSASVGEADYLKHAIQKMGELHAYKLNMKPAKPFNMGLIGNTLILSLPGNPLAALMSFNLLARPMLKKGLGCSSWLNKTLQVPLEKEMTNPSRKLLWVLVVRTTTGVVPLLDVGSPSQSSRLQNIVAADGYISIAPKMEYPAGCLVDFFEFET